jgi:hypothetical protein
MNDTSSTGAIRTGLLIATLVFLAYGLSFLLAPALTWSIGGVNDFGAAGSYRWAGGWLVALGAGAWMIREAPAEHRTMLTLYALGNALSCVGVLWYWLTDFTGATWFAALPFVLNICFAAFFWWARGQAEG